MEITKDQLQDWYDSMSNKELADKLEVSIVTLSKILKENNIKMKGKGNWYSRNSIKVV